jgi:DNA processing protein
VLEVVMTLDHAVALSLLPDLSRSDLTGRLQADDPELLERAVPLLDEARRVRARAAAGGTKVLAWLDADFPASLLTLTDCPPALWYRGTLESLVAPSVAIVGSRAASAVALETATRLGAELAARGVTVVSGLARGVDSAAHRGALETGQTVAVLGSGPDRIYPPEHDGLVAEMIERGGAVLSEYSPGTAPLPCFFPMRNRIISGLSRAVVVIEASEKSGSLITARCALEQGREVMAVPGNVLSGRNRGGHALIRDGATIVESAADVLEALGWLPRAAAGETSARTGGAATTSADPLLSKMVPGDPCGLDALARDSGLDPARLIARLSDLELRGLVRRAGGGRFVRPA